VVLRLLVDEAEVRASGCVPEHLDFAQPEQASAADNENVPPACLARHLLLSAGM